MLVVFALIFGAKAQSYQNFSSLQQQRVNSIVEKYEKLTANGSKVPDTILGKPVGGDFTWAIWLNTLIASRAIDTIEAVGFNALAPQIVKCINAEYPFGNTFSQLYGAQALYCSMDAAFPQLDSNYMWKQLNPMERTHFIEWMDPGRSWDHIKNIPCGGRPSNYVAVSLMHQAFMLKTGLEKNRTLFDTLFAKAKALVDSERFSFDDDRNRIGRYDRYQFEFGRFMLEASELAGDEEQKAFAKRFFLGQARIWVSLFNVQQWHAAPWGRSLQNAWDDVFQQIPLILRSQYPNKPILGVDQLIAMYAGAMEFYFKNEFNDTTSLNRMFDAGRGTYNYAGKNRHWSYTMGTISKIAFSLADMKRMVPINHQLSKPNLPNVNLYYPFSDRSGVFVLRVKGKVVCLPIVGGFRGSVSSDYEPALYGVDLPKPVASGVMMHLPVVPTKGQHRIVAIGHSLKKIFQSTGKVECILPLVLVSPEPEARIMDTVGICRLKVSTVSERISVTYVYQFSNKFMADSLKVSFVNAIPNDVRIRCSFPFLFNSESSAPTTQPLILGSYTPIHTIIRKEYKSKQKVKRVKSVITYSFKTWTP